MANEDYLESMEQERHNVVTALGINQYNSIIEDAHKAAAECQKGIGKVDYRNMKRDEFQILLELVATRAYMAGMKDGLQKQANDLLEMIEGLQND